MSRRIEHRVVDGVELKRCGGCKQWKPLDEFYKCKRLRDGLRDKCKVCCAKTSAKAYTEHREERLKQYAEWRTKHPAHNRVWCLKNKYNLSSEEYDRMLAAQGGVCAICGRPPGGNGNNSKYLHIDHNHNTGQIRGLLCNYCNHGLGQFQDDPVVLKKAAAYLEKYQTQTRKEW